jgi:hypothetical protein
MRRVAPVQPTQRLDAASRRRRVCALEHAMMDVLMVALAFAFFAAAIGYTYACERL